MNVLNDTAAPSQTPTPKHRHSPRPGASCANIDLQGAWGGGGWGVLQFPQAILRSNTQWRARHERESIWVMLKSALYHGRHKLVKENCRDSWSSPRCWMPTLKRARQPILTLKCSFCMNRLFTQATHFLGFCRSFAVNQLLSSAASWGSSSTAEGRLRSP